ncbi:MAG: hypothetical protein ACUVXA_03410 [Candidatus Jordarchaeum sp.]|uniref:hypothetical protein n=1 Tax=Candidatus Jordarchaeum sp. TaxID=2823881 RepID=UPI00404B74DE
MGDGSFFVISDTHLGLVPGPEEKSKGVICEPDKVGQFVNWLIRLRNGEKTMIKLGPWGNGRKEKVLKPPEKLILNGDILELWDATDRAIDYSSRPIFDLFQRLKCEKIYILGNHDYDLQPLTGAYPSGEQTMSIVKELYPSQSEEGKKDGDKKVITLKKGDRDYLFLHGYQFDRIFRFHPWKLLPGVRSGALAFGRYGDLFIGLLFLGIIAVVLNSIFIQWNPLSFLGFNIGFWNWVIPFLTVVGNPALIFLWAVLGSPRIFYLYGRKVWNRVVGTRYNRKVSIKGILSWWRRFSKNRTVTGKKLRIIYGHTHLFDAVLPDELSKFSRKKEKVDIAVFNTPAWVKDWSEKHRQKLRAACLYIDDEDELFLGWNWNAEKPFLVPVEVVLERRENGAISEKTAKKLLSIDWPQRMVDIWSEK